MSNELEKYIRSNPDELDRKKPDAAVLGRVLEEMKSKRNDRPHGIVISFRFLKWAAACLLVAACGIAWWYFNKQEPVKEVVQTSLPEKREPQQPGTDSAARIAVDVVDAPVTLRKEVFVRKAKQTVLLAGLYNMQSAASRITAVTSVSRRKNNNNDVVDVLVQVLNNDPSTNVRLTALDGLTRFYRETYVRKKLVVSLKKQHDPIVQIHMIGLLTRMRELSILADLEKMVNDDNTNKAVKDIAYSGIQQLRPEMSN